MDSRARNRVVTSDRGAGGVNGRGVWCGVLLMVALMLGGCFPGLKLHKWQRDAIVGFSYEARLVPAEGDRPRAPHLVSALRGGDSAGPRIIYVHGTPGDKNGFAAYLAEPVAGLESVSFDRPGFGATLPRGSVTSFAAQAAAIEPLLVERDGRWPILVGHSLGGPTVAWAAAAYPDKVGGIVILAGSLDPGLEQPKWFNRAGQMLLVRPIMGRALRNSNDEIMDAPQQTRLLGEVLHNVRCPVSIVHGTADKLVPVDNVDYMLRAFAHLGDRVTVRVIEGEGHFLPWLQEGVVREAIAEMADRLRAER